MEMHHQQQQQQQQQQPEVGRSAMTYDEVSMERSKSFVKALQELKNLRPQLYSAAEYCEKSYVQSEQKQMVLDNLKDYAVRALVNAVDHLGTVAYKLTDLLEQHTLDISNTDLKITSLNQQLLMCQTFTDKEGLRQQQLLTIVPRHHKRYTLPNVVNKKVHFSPRVEMDPRQQALAKPRLYPSGTPAAKTLSWHLASETKSSLKGSQRTSSSADSSKGSGRTSSSVNSLDAEQNDRSKSSAHVSQMGSLGPASSTAIQTLGIIQRDAMVGSKPMTPFRSFENANLKEIVRVPARSKSVLSSFFVKQKTQKPKSTTV